MGPSEDGFADNLPIPTYIEAAEPQQKGGATQNASGDAFQQAILNALKNAGNDDASVTADIRSLSEAYTQNPQGFLRYLASNPAWRVFEEHGKRFATRRWMIGDWRYTLHGYYTSSDINPLDQKEGIHFQTRLTLDLSGQAWVSPAEASILQAGETKDLALSQNDGQLAQYESFCIIKTDHNLGVEIMEQSNTKERRITTASLAYLQNEFKPLVNRPDWATMKKLLPDNSIRIGTSSLELSGSGGTYDATLWINPGEAGMIYLKAFEVTKSAALSADELKQSSNEWVGWSDNSQELFFSNLNIMIYEGDWEKPYAARFEVWFVPDSGASERKLIERVFKIEGWQR